MEKIKIGTEKMEIPWNGLMVPTERIDVLSAWTEIATEAAMTLTEGMDVLTEGLKNSTGIEVRPMKLADGP